MHFLLQDGSLPEIIGVCDAEHSVEWLSVLFAYKGFVLLAGVFLAFETRKVNLAALNESRFIAMSVYGAAIVSIALTPIGFLLENFPDAQYSILGIMILISVTIILGLVFLSKVRKLFFFAMNKIAKLLDVQSLQRSGWKEFT